MTKRLLVALVLIFAVVMNACAPAGAPVADTDGATSQNVAMTFVGTPRNETLILDNLGGRVERPDFFNPYAPGVDMGRGYHEVCLDNLWEINTITGEQFPALAAEMPKPLNDDYTSFEIKLREGIYWDDGVEFTADDVVCTLQLGLTNDKLPIHGWSVDFLKDVRAVDKYTVIVDTTRPQPRFSKVLGVTIWDATRFWPVPKHVWEKEDPTTFAAFPPVCLGQYKYSKHDPNGNWTLWELHSCNWRDTQWGDTQHTGKGAQRDSFNVSC